MSPSERHAKKWLRTQIPNAGRGERENKIRRIIKRKESQIGQATYVG